MLDEDIVKRANTILSNVQPFYPETPEGTITPAAVWSDDIKEDGFNALDDWHYLDKPYVIDDVTPIVDPTNGNILFALEHAERLLKDKRSREWERSLMLHVLLHVAGDIHQPLHTISLYSHRFPRGDRGGNFIRINDPKDPNLNNLHKFWDSGAGSFPDYPLPDNSLYRSTLVREESGLKWLGQFTKELIRQHPLDSFDESEINMNYTYWLESSWETAKSKVYDPLLVQGANNHVVCAYLFFLFLFFLSFLSSLWGFLYGTFSLYPLQHCFYQSIACLVVRCPPSFCTSILHVFSLLFLLDFSLHMFSMKLMINTASRLRERSTGV